MWYYADLSDTLSGLYYRTDDIVALLTRSGLHPAHFDLENPAHVVWTLLISKVEQMDRIEDIVDASLRDYPNNPILLDYKNKNTVITKSIYSGNKPAWKGTPDNLERITGSQSTLLPLRFLELGMMKAKSVARVKTPAGLGTGFLISADNLFLTNNHVLDTLELANTSTVQFNYQQTLKGLPDEFEEFEVEDTLFETSVSNDWSVVKIKGNPVEKYGFLELKEVKVHPDDFVNIIQHPGGEHKQLGLYHNVVTNVSDDRVQYLTDTLPGSSGSPVFNSLWEVVALHHSGGWFEEPNSNKSVLRNEGIRINKIRNSLLELGLNI